MKKFQPTLEHALYALALALAVILHFVHLGTLSLSDYEARWAYQAVQVVGGLHPAIGSNPAYIHLTAVLFYIFGATNFLARFWPAMAGCALVLIPWLLRGRLGRVPALVLAFGLALDPGLAAMSHLAGGPMLAIAFVILTILMWMDGRRALAGLFGGLALLSGPSAWFGLMGLALVWAFGMAFEPGAPAPAKKESGGGKADEAPARPGLEGLWKALAWGAGALLVVGSLFVLSPKGLSGFAASFLEFVRGWWKPSGIPIWRVALALPAYEILPLGFGIAGAVRGILKRDPVYIRLGIWALVALFLALIYPGKQTGDLVWALLPLWALTALELGHHFDFAGRNLRELAATVAFVGAILVFGWLNLAGITNMDLGTPAAHTRLYMLIAVLALVVLSLLLVGTGWSVNLARLGGVWAAVITLTLFTLAMSTGAAGLREPLTAELWQPEPRSGRLDELLKVANQISDLNKGAADQLPLTLLNEESPALLWLFRNWQVQQVGVLAPDASPEMIITPQSDLSLSANYRGEALALHETVSWSQATAANWLKWFIYRQMPVQRDNVILWVRNDLMLDSQGTTTVP